LVVNDPVGRVIRVRESVGSSVRIETMLVVSTDFDL